MDYYDSMAYDDVIDYDQPFARYESAIFYEDENDYEDQFQSQDLEYDYEYDYDVKSSESISELYDYCIGPTFYDAWNHVFPILVVTFVLKVIGQSQFMPRKGFHALSAILGFYLVQRFGSECLYQLTILIAISYAILRLSHKRYTGVTTSFACLCIILHCEWWMQPVAWHKVRSITMIAAMKSVSVAVDSMNPSSSIPDFIEYLGYMLCAATCIFGPWISYRDYEDGSQKNDWSLRWLMSVIGYLSAAFMFLSVSNCWAQWIIPDTDWTWLLGYQEALSFRTSHYFVSFMAAGIVILGGFPTVQAIVTKPSYIELPYSLVQVVIYWNIPMHTWLKTYVFRQCYRSLGKFSAVVLTYAISSLLHGINFQLAAVLLSLGFYTYAEFQLRKELAHVFDACIGPKRCMDTKCNHKKRTTNCWWVIMINLLFSGLACFHLAYLGMTFDASEQQEVGYSYSHTMEKWSQLHFASHWVAFATYFVYLMIK